LATKTESQHLYHKLESEIKLKDTPMLGSGAFEICYNVNMGYNKLMLYK